jgi:hypothetical protein
VKDGVLITVEHIQNGAGHAGKRLEVFDGPGIYVHATDAAELRLKGAYSSMAFIEAGSAAAKATEKVEVLEFYFLHFISLLSAG